MRRAEAAVFVLAGASLALKIAVAGGLPEPWLRWTLVLTGCCALAAYVAGRGRSILGPWRLLVVLSLLVALPGVYERVGGDGIEYFALARSLCFDQDLDLANDFAGLEAHRIPRLPEGEPTSRFPVGLSLVWLPPLLVCRLVALVLASLGVAVDTTGFGALYQAAATTTSFALAGTSLFLLDRLLRRWYSPAMAGISVLGIWFATPLQFYAVANPSMSHAASAFAATLVLMRWLGARAGSVPTRWGRVGLAGGLMSLIRVQDAALMVVPTLDAVWARRGWRALLALLAGPALAAGAQLVTWRAMYGPDFLVLAAKQGHFRPAGGHVLDLLFAARHGFFSWTPLYVLAVVGVLLWLVRDARLATAALAGIALSVVLNSQQWDWWGADAFGQRRLLGLTPILAIGLAETLDRLRRKPMLMIGCGIAGLALWNQQFAYIYNSELVAGKGQAVSLEKLAAAQVDVMARSVVRLEPDLPRLVFVYLYDNLRGAWLDEGPRQLGNTIDLGDEEPTDFPVVGHGWSIPRQQAGTGWRLSSVRRSWLRVPILTPGDFVVTVRARAAFEAAPVSMDIQVAGESIGRSALALEWQESRFLLAARLLEGGVNDIAFCWSVTPADVLPGFHGRNAAAAVDWVRFERKQGK